MQVVLFLLFLVFIPTFAVLGHDIYLYMENQDDGFLLSTLGYIWTQYDLESHNAIIADLSGEPIVVGGTEILNVDILTAILGRKAVEVTGALGVILASLIIVIKLIAVLFAGLNASKFKAKRKHH